MLRRQRTDTDRVLAGHQLSTSAQLFDAQTHPAKEVLISMGLSISTRVRRAVG